MNIITFEGGSVLTIDEFRYLRSINASIKHVTRSEWNDMTNTHNRHQVVHHTRRIHDSDDDSIPYSEEEFPIEEEPHIEEELHVEEEPHVVEELSVEEISSTHEESEENAISEVQPISVPEEPSDNHSMTTCSICLDEKPSNEMCYPTTCSPSHTLCYPSCVSIMAQQCMQSRPRLIKCPCCRQVFNKVTHNGVEKSIPNVLTALRASPTSVNEEEGCPLCWGIYSSIPSNDFYFHDKQRGHRGPHRRCPRNYIESF